MSKKRKDGYFQKKLLIKDKDGIERNKFIYAKTKIELEEKTRAFLADYERGTLTRENVTVRAYSEKWIESISTGLSYNSIRMYQSNLNKINAELGGILLKDLKRSDIQTLVTNWSHEPRTAQYIKQTIHKLLESAIDDEFIYKNVCRNITLAKYKAKEKVPLSAFEIEALTKADLTDQQRLFVSILYHTGLRRGEVLALSRKDIDLKNNILSVNHSLAFENNKGYLKEPKTEKGKRKVPIPGELHRQLASYKYGMYLFTIDGGMFTKYAFDKMWNDIRKRLNATIPGTGINAFKGFTAHRFRHNYASYLHDNDIDAKSAQNLLGHSSITTTMDIYTHLQELGGKTIEKINNIFETKTS